MNQLNVENQVKAELKNFVLSENHACVMAKGVFERENITFKLYEELGTKDSAAKLFLDIKNFISSINFEKPIFTSFVASFNSDNELSEKDFEKRLWSQLTYLNWFDDIEWDPTVSSNPNSTNFSFSIAGKAFYIVGMHPNSSRKSRRAPYPTLVFNLHNQFELLRKNNSFESVQKIIRENDKKIQGSINPMLEDFGHGLEAKQYSGRKVDDNWKCPFSTK